MSEKTEPVSSSEDPTRPGDEPPIEDVWLVSYGDDDDRELTVEQISHALRAGEIDGETIAWRDGMADWLPISQIPQLVGRLPESLRPAPASAGFLGTGIAIAPATGGAEPTASEGAPESAEPPPPMKAATDDAPESAEPMPLVRRSVPPPAADVESPKGPPAAPRPIGSPTVPRVAPAAGTPTIPRAQAAPKPPAAPMKPASPTPPKVAAGAPKPPEPDPPTIPLAPAPKLAEAEDPPTIPNTPVPEGAADLAEELDEEEAAPISVEPDSAPAPKPSKPPPPHGPRLRSLGGGTMGIFDEAPPKPPPAPSRNKSPEAPGVAAKTPGLTTLTTARVAPKNDRVDENLLFAAPDPTGAGAPAPFDFGGMGDLLSPPKDEPSPLMPPVAEPVAGATPIATPSAQVVAHAAPEPSKGVPWMGLIAAAAVLLGGGFWFMSGAGGETPSPRVAENTPPPSVPARVATEAPAPKQAAPSVPAAAASTAPVVEDQESAKKEKAKAKAGTSAEAKPTSDKEEPKAEPKAEAKTEPKAEEKKEEPKAEEKKEEPEKPKKEVALGGEFNSAAAKEALGAAAAKASGCRKDGDPSGVAQLRITYAPSGRVTSALISGPPFAGTATGGCIAGAMRTATVPPFSGDMVTVSKKVVIQ